MCLQEGGGVTAEGTGAHLYVEPVLSGVQNACDPAGVADHVGLREVMVTTSFPVLPCLAAAIAWCEAQTRGLMNGGLAESPTGPESNDLSIMRDPARLP